MTDFTYPPKDPELAGEPIRETGYGAYTGPIHRQQRPDGVRFAMRIAPHHLNGIDRMHGGMTMSLASLAMGEAAQAEAAARAPGMRARTLSFNCDFVSAGELGDVVTGEAEVTRATRSVLFLSGRFTVGSRILMTASGIYGLESEPGENGGKA
ncbi:acyl-coenzyme A thioesterase PaaI-like protein [Parvibaculum indicum]|uniref:hotdog domain-containing protein n=1 Tax=Parvibaculum indicum TaxID=562969 RepID=UPI00142136DF|nr:acyl-coenzyme A thioesterase PaaI-like protein [Parvibaculum indicum]